MEEKIIKIRGARTHNLKNINLEIPRDKLVVITGLSGSGKSSLAFDTIFAEGQRRYVESLSAYARQFLKQMQKPDVDEISGLSPAISIDQKSRSQNPRSTVATITEIYDYLRVLYARVGKPYCLVCGQEIKKLSNEEIVNFVKEKIAEISTRQDCQGQSLTMGIYAPLVRGRKGEYYQLLYDLLDKGYTEVLIDGNRKKLRERIILAKTTKHEIDVLVDEVAIKEFIYDDVKNSPAPKATAEQRKTKIKESVEKAVVDSANERLSEAVERALKESEGLVRIMVGSPNPAKVLRASESFLMSSKFACPNDGFSYPEIEPRLFSFNSPYGACSACHGLGTKHLWSAEPCPECHGARLRQEALHVLVGGKNIVDLSALAIDDAYNFFAKIKLSPKEKAISKVVLKEIESRLQFLLNVGLDYMALDRRANTLSGGEAQRIRLASQLGSRLVGTLYVLDEPTIGLHQHDNDKLITTLKGLRDLGNTIIVVEHDEDTIFSSDYLVDIGPGAGRHGGKVIVSEYT
ncbi:MAG: excinuclease ABC subunit UvrA, partial [Patescibacteria group bacterium]